MPTKAIPEDLDPSPEAAEEVALMALALSALQSTSPGAALDDRDLRRGRPGFSASHLTIHDETDDALVWMHPTLIAAFKGLYDDPEYAARRAVAILHDGADDKAPDSLTTSLNRDIIALMKTAPDWAARIQQRCKPAQTAFQTLRDANKLACPAAALNMIADACATLPLRVQGEIAARARHVYAWGDHSYAYGFSETAIDALCAASRLLEPESVPKPDTEVYHAALLAFAIRADSMTEDECRFILDPCNAAPIVAALTHLDDPAEIDHAIRFWPEPARSTEALRQRRYWAGLDVSQSIAILLDAANDTNLSNHQAIGLQALASNRLREHGIMDVPTPDWARRIRATVPKD